MSKRFLIPIFIILSITSMFVGVKDISILDIISFNQDKLNVFFISRVPRLISIVLAGVGMSICGVIMQQISNNKFVSPTTAATIDSAQLGVIVAMLIFSEVTVIKKMVVAFAFSLIGTLLVMNILKKIKLKNVIFIPLIGIMVGKVIGSLGEFVAYKFNVVQDINAFFQGKFAMVIQGKYELLYLAIPFLIVAFLYANKFTIIGMGEDISSNLGLNYNNISNIGIVIVAIITSLIVITVGSIPFVGLIVPNIVSMFKGDNLSKNLWITSLFGADFVLACDILGRLIMYPYEVSISLTIGVIGGFTFLYLILRGDKIAA